MLVAGPEFADVEEISVFLSQRLDPFFCEALGEVLDGVESEASESYFGNNPLAPVCDVLAHLGVRVVEIGKHEEIGITALVVYTLTPSLTLTLNLEDSIASTFSIIIRTTEMIPMVLLLAVLVASAFKVETQPCGDLMTVRDLLVAVVGVDFDDVAFLLLVGGGFVVEHRVPVETDARVLCGFGEGHQFIFRAPLGGLAALLVEFAEVVEIVDVVAVALEEVSESVWGNGEILRRCGGLGTYVGGAGFAAGREPDVGDTNVLVCGHGIVQTNIVLAISRNIPLKALEQSVVLRSRFFAAHG